ncbi:MULTISPECIES: hypothetical protein [unclassified Spiroplasma]|uniref:hypothetical protein n=1 Tax=unclassified Spiroplasma TaxID=2637901 RepID=UPI00313C44DB
MRKFLSALNLVCIMFISGCNRGNNTLITDNAKKYELNFIEILNSNFTSSTSNDWGGWLNISSIKNELPFDVSNSVEPLTSYKPIDGFKDIRIFYERNGKSESNKYTIDKIVNVKITFSKNKDLGFSQYLITSFFAEIPNKN